MRRLAVVLICGAVTFWSSVPIVQGSILRSRGSKIQGSCGDPGLQIKRAGWGGEISLKELKNKIVVLNFFEIA